MSRFHQEIRNAMSNLESPDESNARAWFRFPRAFVGFRGHFEGRPVLPGICEMHAAQVVLEAAKRRSFRMTEVTMAKYFSPVSHDEEILVECGWQDKGEGFWDLRASVRRKEARVAVLHLVFGDAN